MPGWKKNIPACLQPDQEGGKTEPGRAGPDGAALARTDRARVRPCVTIPAPVLVCAYTLCACARARVLANYRRCDLVQCGVAPPAERVQTETGIIGSW